jgi:hypothetical protein
MKFILGAIAMLLLLAGCGEKTGEPAIDEKAQLIIDTTDIVTEPVENPEEIFL